LNIAHIDTDKEVLVIAEIGNNHEGSCSLAEEMIYLAGRAGAGAVKFQTYKTELFVRKKDKDRFNRLKSFELTNAEFEKLSKVAKTAGMLFISTPLDLESAMFLNTIVDAYKIASGDNNFYPLIEAIARTGKPIIMSSGLADIDQMKKSQKLVHKIWKDNDLQQDLAILHCVSAYPVIPEQANLKAINFLQDKLDCTIGYSDHTVGIDASLIAVALGARIIEKHFTIDKNHSDFRDHKLSADYEEFKRLVEKTRTVSLMMGNGRKILQESEINFMEQSRRSIVAKRNLPKGVELKMEDITWLRPANALQPGQECLLIGKKLSKSIRSGEPITLECVID